MSARKKLTWFDTWSAPTAARRAASWIAKTIRPGPDRDSGHKSVGGRQALSHQLEEFTATFSACHGKTEADFVESSRALRALYSTAETLARLVSERLEAMRAALGDSRIGGPDGIAAGALRDLQNSFAEASQELLLLHSVTDQLRQFRTQVEDIDRVGKSARLSVFLFAVESARTADCQELFGAFVSELRTLGDRITEAAQAIDQSARQAQQAQEAECEGMSASHGKLSELAKKIEATATATAAAAQTLLDESLVALKQAQAHMQRITKEAGEAVFYLQFGDIVRQKTEHIAAALQDAAAQLAGANSETEFQARAGLVDHTLAIQVGQLELIRSEVEAARRKLGTAFENLGSAAGALNEVLQHWRQDSDGQKSTSGAVTAFKADLGLMENLQRDGAELRRAVRRAAQSVSAASSQLAVHVGQVKAINMDVHLQALNAIVKAAALGEHGVTLSVLSMYVDWLYRESDAAVAEVINTLEAILKAADRNSGTESLAEGQSGQPTLQSGMEKILGPYEDCRKTSGLADELVAKQQAALSDGRASLDFLDRHLPAIESQIQALASFRQSLAPWLKNSPAPAGGSVEALQQRYTMQSEHDIHAKLQSGAAAPLAVPTPEVEADNLVMFDALPATGTDSPAPALATEAAGNSTAPTEAPTAPAPSDNVEFF
jgi:hypothetical protein